MADEVLVLISNIILPLLLFFQLRLLLRAWPPGATGAVLVTAGTPATIVVLVVVDMDGRTRWPLARELTAVITFCASGPSYGRKKAAVSEVGEVN